MATAQLTTPQYGELERRHIEKIMTLSQHAWEGHCDQPVIDRWLSCFNGRSGHGIDVERLHALHLLSNFLYFGTDEVRELLRALYRDVFRYQSIERIRKANEDTSDSDLISRLYDRELQATRFLPLGNPSESSSHLLYYFRQVNDLPADLFAHVHDVIDSNHPVCKITRCVFLDDFAGTGNQAIEYSKVVKDLRTCGVQTISYYAMVATPNALHAIAQCPGLDDARCVVELEQELRAFSDGSLFFVDRPPKISQKTMRQIATTYGDHLCQGWPLGYGDGELLLGFAHNIPDNTLPIFWAATDAWRPPFPRYIKWSYR